MLHFPIHIKIISGGQTGVDRAALDFAIDHNILCGGWCPRGRLAEDGVIPDKYPLKETFSSDFKERTEQNIIDSNATLIIYAHEIDNGTKLTNDLCKKFHKPILQVDLNGKNYATNVTRWIDDHQINVLNIAGPRESNAPGIYIKTLKFLTLIFGLDYLNE